MLLLARRGDSKLNEEILNLVNHGSSVMISESALSNDISLCTSKLGIANVRLRITMQIIVKKCSIPSRRMVVMGS